MDSIVIGHTVYRALLAAMSRPGSVQALPPGALDRPVVRLLGALLDAQVSFHVARSDAAGAELERELRWTTGGQVMPMEEADFVIFPEGRSGGAVRALKRGTPEYPDRAATAVYCVEELYPEGGGVVLRGPGIRDAASPRFQGWAEEEVSLLREINAEYPMGIDVVLLDGRGRLMGLPRSTRIEVR